jgi:hypothetical protein
MEQHKVNLPRKITFTLNRYAKYKTSNIPCKVAWISINSTTKEGVLGSNGGTQKLTTYKKINPNINPFRNKTETNTTNL